MKDTLALPDVSRSMQARLHFIAGEIHRENDDAAAARAAYEAALEVKNDYAPALRALVVMGDASDSLLARLVLATASIEAPTLEKTLPP